MTHQHREKLTAQEGRHNESHELGGLAGRDVLQCSGLLRGCFGEQVDIQRQSKDHQRLRRRAVGLIPRLHGAAALSVVMGQCWLSVKLFFGGQHLRRDVGLPHPQW